MKTVVMIITAVAVAGVAVGGSMLDSQSLALPVAMIVPSMAWLGLLGWVNTHD